MNNDAKTRVYPVIPIIIVVVILVTVYLSKPGLLRFWPFTVAEFVELMGPILLLALIIERFVEAIKSAGRGPKEVRESAELQRKLSEARSASAVSKNKPQGLASTYESAAQDLAANKGRTIQRTSILALVLGIIVSALGVRILEQLVDPAIFATLSVTQQSLIRVADVLFSGALLGGGAEPLHRLVRIYTEGLALWRENISQRRTTS